MKYAFIYSLFLLFVFTSCTQNQTTKVPDNSSKGLYSDSQLKAADSARVPMSMVRNVKKSRNGDILVASYLAVFKYDSRQHDTARQGTSFTNLTGNLISSRFSSFWDVIEDRKGNLWFGSKDSGVYHYPAHFDGNAGQKGVLHFTKKDGLGSNSALHIYEDKAGNIWFGTGGGATRYDGNTFRNFTTKDGLPSNDINTFMEDKNGNLWIGTRGDMCYYDGKKFTVLRNKDGHAFYNVWGILEDKKGNIWFGGSIIRDKKGSTLYLDPGLWRYDGSTITKVSQRSPYVIIQDKKGNIWTTGEVNPHGNAWALSRYDADSLYNDKPTVTDIKAGHRMNFLGMVEANDGSIWFGSNSGVHRYDGKTFTDFAGAAAIK